MPLCVPAYFPGQATRGRRRRNAAGHGGSAAACSSNRRAHQLDCDLGSAGLAGERARTAPRARGEGGPFARVAPPRRRATAQAEPASFKPDRSLRVRARVALNRGGLGWAAQTPCLR
ncbi:unnamed protein product [Prorocentrum cordatum]|uniref:Uncharacterized protein n=1 Tax=Prorocentrum cordatum TaxID=2364126 RepID=A0ABN9Y7N1_9DINO|nr:unnamed protein product [Polarella glacialis]